MIWDLFSLKVGRWGVFKLRWEIDWWDICLGVRYIEKKNRSKVKVNLIPFWSWVLVLPEGWVVGRFGEYINSFVIMILILYVLKLSLFWSYSLLKFFNYV